MRERYGITARDLFKMSWREFRVLFESLVSREILGFGDGVTKIDDAEYAPDGNKFDAIKDWQDITGEKSDAINKGTVSFDDYMKRNNIQKRIIDG